MTAEAPAPSISVVVPAYNEADRLPASLEKILTFLSARGDPAEVLVVDDGSDDGTAELAEGILAASEVAGRVLVNEENRGKGHSVRRGMLAARAPLVLFSDADLSTPIEDLEALEAAIEAGADIAIGSRDTEGSEVLRHQAWYRESAGKAFNVVVRLLAAPGIRDTQCGFKLFRREVIEPVFGRQTVERWGFDVEVVYVARRLGYEVAEVPVRWVNDERSKVSFLRDGTVMLLDLLRIRWRHRGLEQDHTEP